MNGDSRLGQGWEPEYAIVRSPLASVLIVQPADFAVPAA
jgi:hypothetical protein